MLMLNKRATEADCRNYIIINPRWKRQNAKIKLAFAMGLNERLGENSVLNDIPLDIINCIVENIDRLPIRDPIWEPELHLVLNLRGGGKKRHKSKRIKSKRNKSKRRKSKRRKSKQIKNTRRK